MQISFGTSKKERRRKKTVQTQVASLLLIVSSVALASVVIGFAVAITEQTLSLNDNPQVDRIKNIQDTMLNETNTWMESMQNQLLNQTVPTNQP